EELPSLHTDIRTETIPKTTIEESDPSKFIGDNSVKQVGEDGERQIVTSYEELHGKKISESVETVTILKEMKPEIIVKGTKERHRGQGSETSKLDERPLRLELKKVEIKNIASTNLVKVNDDGTETPSDFMNEKPSEEDVKKMYLKITSRDNKVTRLTVDSIEEVT
ncbi:ZmpA/ZmpB/ZmpC family metallo-endopeptidase-related protein, partial [Streptococcus pneumoniae]|uniref:ZmpA/ZmpB/ZmpC family metallo-endopeptidase-related protein n=1 Tax=Streptococcus pneumoniae TaxID=1313 RepID=UPI0015C5DB56